MADQNYFQKNPLFPVLDTNLDDTELYVNVGVEWKKQPDPMVVLTSQQLLGLESQRIRKVEILRNIATGSEGQVCEILADFNINSETDEQPVWQQMRFALKIIHHKRRDRMDRNLNEIRVLCRLRHENIANMIEFLGIPDTVTGFPVSKVCIISELCDNTLLDLRQSHPDTSRLPEYLNRHWFAQVIRGLNYLHSNGIIHSDLHESNILYRLANDDNNGDYENRFLSSTFKIADFGLSKIVKDHFIDRNSLDQLILIDIMEVVSALEDSIDSPGLPGPLTDLLNDPPKSTILLLLHPWLQMNTESRTEPYILRQHFELSVQPTYNEWEAYRSKDDPNYAPFGLADGQRQSTIPFNEWRAERQPLFGCAPPDFQTKNVEKLGDQGQMSTDPLQEEGTDMSRTRGS